MFGRIGLAAIFIAGGILHLVKPALYRPYMPQALPAHDALILISGLAEIAGGWDCCFRRPCVLPASA